MTQFIVFICKVKFRYEEVVIWFIMSPRLLRKQGSEIPSSILGNFIEKKKKTMNLSSLCRISKDDNCAVGVVA